MHHLNEIQSAILGIIQGLTEFLPISSSAHLIIVRHLFSFPEPGKTFDILMHFGTLVALFVYFGKDLVKLFQDSISHLKKGDISNSTSAKLLAYMVISTIPGGVFGLLYKDKLENIQNIYLISGLLIFFGITLFVSDKVGSKSKKISDFTVKDALIIGFAQALALFPGVSRSGITMTFALFLGFSREDSARYSFLISIPLISGVSIYGLYKLFSTGVDNGTLLVYGIGFLASAISGFLCIKYLLEYLKKGTFSVFVVYRVALGILLISLAALGKIH